MTTRGARQRPVFRTQWALSMALALAAIGFVAAAQWNSSLSRQQVVTSAERVLVSRAQELQRQQERLTAEIEEADAELQALQERTTGSASELEQITEQLRAARVAAGAVALRGPGVVVEIADSLRDVPPGERAGNYIILVDDLRDIVTALWASGAEAISITSGHAEGAPTVRLVSTSSIYGAGPAILINTELLSPPYVIQAIGPDGLRDRFLTHPAFLARVEKRVSAYELQFATEARDEITVPPFAGNTRLQWGAPVLEREP